MFGVSKVKKIILLIAALLLTKTIYAQDSVKSIIENPRIKRPLGISFNLGSPTYIASISLDIFILPVLNIEFGGGIWGYFGGAKYHFRGNMNKRETVYTGIVVTAYPPLEIGPSWGNKTTPHTIYGVYVPIGLSTVSKTGYTFSIEMAFNSKNQEFTSFPLWFSLKFGYHF
jgi:hypothetical protein